MNQVQDFFDNSSLSYIILPWSTIPTSTTLQKDILLRREELYIGQDGISFCKKKDNLREYYFFAPELKQNRFLKYISDNLEIIKPEINVFRKDSFAQIKNHAKKAAKE